MIDIALIAACAPNVAPSTIEAIIKVESNTRPYVINVNAGSPISKEFKSRSEAVRASKKAIAAGYSVDMGYMQVNSSNLKSLGYSVEDMFDSCKNIAAGGKILHSFYVRALSIYKNEQAALRAALSAYNTGHFERGKRNGYVRKLLITASLKTNKEKVYAVRAVGSKRPRTIKE